MLSFLRRRFKKTFDIILSSCNLYLADEKNLEKSPIVNEVIRDIKAAGKIFEEEQKGEGINQLLAVLSLLSSVIVPVILSNVPQVVSAISSVFVQIVFYSATFVVLSIYGLSYFLPQIRTYFAVALFYKFENKERIIYLPLGKMVTFILNHDPTINKLADESYYNFIWIIFCFFKNKKADNG